MHRLGQTQGSSLRCDCGATLFVSLQGRLVTAIDPQQPELNDAATPSDDATIARDNPLVTSDDDASTTSSIATRSAIATPIIAVDTEETAPKTRKDKDAKRRNEPPDKERPAKRKSKNSWPLLAGGGVVALLLLASIAMFLWQPGNSNKPKSTRARSKVVTQQQASAPRKEIVIEPGTLKELATKIPAPSLTQPVANASGASVRNTSVTPTKNSNASTPTESERSPYGGQTEAPVVSLPARVEPRQRVPIVVPAKSSRFFDEAYNLAYQSYEAWSELGDDATDSEEYQTKLGETLGAVKVAYGLSLKRDDLEKRNELLYLLTFLSLKAGHLMEAAIYGETAARLGDPNDSATRDAAFIALAAVQEASANHWGNPNDVGELRLMETIAQLIDTKWPDEPQRNKIWLTLAQTYASFGHPRPAVAAYAQVDENSPLANDARIGSGVAYWTIFLTEASDPDADPEAMLGLLQKASQQFAAAVKSMEPKLKAPSMPLLTAKQMLAVIAARTHNNQSVIRWTTTGKFPLTKSIRVQKKGKPRTVVVSSTFAKTVFQLLYQAQTDEGKLQEAQKTLETLDSLLGKQSGSDIKSMQFATAIRAFKEAIAKDNVTMSDVTSLNQTLAKLPPQSPIVSPHDRLWIANSWSTLAKKATDDRVATQCYDHAAQTSELAIAMKSFPQNLVAATRVHQAEWLRLANKTDASLRVLGEILKTTPNVFDLQMQAVLSLEKLAIERDSEPDLQSAIRGPKEQPSIWGWSKLAVQLHKLRYSDRGTPEHAESLLQAHFHLARCRWMLFTVLSDGSERETLRKQTLKQIASARLAIPEGSEAESKWTAAFTQIESDLSSRDSN